MSDALRAAVPGDSAVADTILARAGELGLLGWVRTDDDGMVRVHAEGDDAAVASLRESLGDDAVEERAKVEGHEQLAVRGVPAGAFLVRAHDAGFDLVLEVGEGLRVWTLRKEPSMNPSDKRMAIAVDEPTPGELDLWDRGPYEQGGRVAWPEALDRGHAVFVLHGDKLRGGFALQRTRGVQWLLIKRRDVHAQTSS